MPIRAFSKIWIVSIILTLLIIFVGGVLIYLFIFKVIKAEVPCTPPYGSSCLTKRDCLLQTRCVLGQGIICFHQCKLEGFDFLCLNGQCVWSKSGKGRFEKDLIPLQ